MLPLYIPATNTIVRNSSEKCIHPRTGEVYGGSDYSRPDKVAEFGGVPLIAEEDQPHADGDVRDGEEVIVSPDGKSARLVRKWRARNAGEVDALRASKVAAIKARAATVLRSDDWRLQRAMERLLRDQLPAAEKALIDKREAVRAASDEAEADVLLAKDAAEVERLPAFIPGVVTG